MNGGIIPVLEYVRGRLVTGTHRFKLPAYRTMAPVLLKLSNTAIEMKKKSLNIVIRKEDSHSPIKPIRGSAPGKIDQSILVAFLSFKFLLIAHSHSSRCTMLLRRTFVKSSDLQRGSVKPVDDPDPHFPQKDILQAAKGSTWQCCTRAALSSEMPPFKMRSLK